MVDKLWESCLTKAEAELDIRSNTKHPQRISFMGPLTQFSKETPYKFVSALTSLVEKGSILEQK